MEKDVSFTRVEILMMDNGKVDRSMGLENMFGKMEGFMKETSTKVSNTDLDSSFGRMESRLWGNGTWEK